MLNHLFMHLFASFLNRQINQAENLKRKRREDFTGRCIACRHLVRLPGLLDSEYGECANPESEFNQRVRFECDGCLYFDASGS